MTKKDITELYEDELYATSDELGNMDYDDSYTNEDE